MTRVPLLFPRPGRAHRTLRRPPLPGIRGPAVGRLINASCSSRYSSSVSRSCTRRVKTEVSIMTMAAPRVVVHDRTKYAPMAYSLSRVRCVVKVQSCPRAQCLTRYLPKVQCGAGGRYLCYHYAVSQRVLECRGRANHG